MAIEDTYIAGVIRHYESFWKNPGKAQQWRAGPMSTAAPLFRVLEFPPTRKRSAWTYATAGMSDANAGSPVELHLFAPAADPIHIETLTVVAHYHRTGASLAMGHTVDLGRPWLPGSRASCALLSLPYLDGPELEHAVVDATNVHFLWLIPITPEERDFKVENGLEALEELFDEAELDYLDPHRPSVV